MNIILQRELQDIPCTIQQRVNCFNNTILEVNCLNTTFTIVKELYEDNMYELGYHSNNGLQVLRYLTIDDVLNNIVEISMANLTE